MSGPNLFTLLQGKLVVFHAHSTLKLLEMESLVV